MNTGAWYFTHAPTGPQPSPENQSADATRFCTQCTRHKKTATKTIVSNCFKPPPVGTLSRTQPTPSLNHENGTKGAWKRYQRCLAPDVTSAFIAFTCIDAVHSRYEMSL